MSKKEKATVRIFNFLDYLVKTGDRKSAFEMVFEEGGAENFITMIEDKAGTLIVFKA